MSSGTSLMLSPSSLILYVQNLISFLVGFRGNIVDFFFAILPSLYVIQMRWIIYENLFATPVAPSLLLFTSPNLGLVYPDLCADEISM